MFNPPTPERDNVITIHDLTAEQISNMGYVFETGKFILYIYNIDSLLDADTFVGFLVRVLNSEDVRLEKLVVNSVPIGYSSPHHKMIYNALSSIHNSQTRATRMPKCFHFSHKETIDPLGSFQNILGDPSDQFD